MSSGHRADVVGDRLQRTRNHSRRASARREMNSVDLRINLESLSFHLKNVEDGVIE